jgi:hypothetical protein
MVELIGGIIALLAVSGSEPPVIPKTKPWLVLARAAGLGTREDSGLAFAIWLDGTMVRRVPGDPTRETFEIGLLDAKQVEDLSKVVTTSGIERRRSASRYIDLPEDGLVLRAKGQTRCWYDTPGVDATPGLAVIAQSALSLQLKHPKILNLGPKQWLPWSHHWEKACAP